MKYQESSRSPQQEVQAAIAAQAANNRLLGTIAVADIEQGLDDERTAGQAWAKEAHAALWGSEVTGGCEEGESEMRITAAGNVTIHSPAEKQAVKKKRNALAKAAMVAAIVGGFGLAGAAVSQFFSEDTDTRYSFGIGENPPAPAP